MRATITPTRHRQIGLLDGHLVAVFHDGCPDAGEYELDLGGWVNTTGERRRVVESYRPANTAAPDAPDALENDLDDLD